MKVKVRSILMDAIESGIEAGYHRAFKHTDEPSEATIKDSIETYVWNSIDDYFTFEDEYEDYNT